MIWVGVGKFEELVTIERKAIISNWFGSFRRAALTHIWSFHLHCHQGWERSLEASHDLTQLLWRSWAGAGRKLCPDSKAKPSSFMQTPTLPPKSSGALGGNAPNSFPDIVLVSAGVVLHTVVWPFADVDYKKGTLSLLEFFGFSSIRCQFFSN